MKLAITSSGPEVSSPMDDRLGRCPYFIIFDTKDGYVRSLRNEAAEASSGAGTKAMQTLIDNDVKAVITGKVGPNAMAVMEEAGMEAFTSATGTVAEAYEAYRKAKGI